MFPCVPVVVGSGGPLPEKFGKPRVQEKPYQIIFQRVDSLKFIWIMPICSCFKGENPHLFFLLNVFEHKIEVIMSWQICREVPKCLCGSCASDCDSLPENNFWNLKTGCLQVGISNSKLGKVICSRDVEAVLIQRLHEGLDGGFSKSVVNKILGN